ncbi:MAG: molybdopterin molybdotransferase MoeA [Acidobacteriota bacterium]|nr:MAG: molybdopterin molybdotransferase MoeA [Acidobacteriota bacterium]
MITIEEARDIVRSKIRKLGTEEVRLGVCVGRVLAEDVKADLDLPPFDRSQMDGYAVISTDTSEAPVTLDLIGESAAGRGWDGVLERGQTVKTMTGARVPKGADAVQQIELAEANGSSVTILESAKAGKNIVKTGAEIREGEIVIPAGERITRAMVASLAAFGYSSVKAARSPRLAILSTGSEIVDVSEKPGPDQIRNSNSAMLSAFASDLADVSVLPIAPDDPEGLRTSISKALDQCDFLVISGGVSVGDYDFTKPVLKDLGAEIHFEKIALKPGKPTVFATSKDKCVFGLPGNPVSIAVTFLVFVRTALLLAQGASDPELRSGFAEVTHDIKGAKGRHGLLPVKTGFREDGRMIVESLKFSGSSNFVTFASADAIASVPADSGLRKGDTAEVYFF